MKTNAGKTYVVSFTSAMAVYTVVMLVVGIIMPRVEQPALKTLLAILPVLPVGFALRAYLRFLTQMDELQRLVQVQAIALAAGVVAMLALAYGLLESLADFPKIGLIWVFPTLVIFWGLGSAFYSRRYQ